MLWLKKIIEYDYVNILEPDIVLLHIIPLIKHSFNLGDKCEYIIAFISLLFHSFTLMPCFITVAQLSQWNHFLQNSKQTPLVTTNVWVKSSRKGQNHRKMLFFPKGKLFFLLQEYILLPYSFKKNFGTLISSVCFSLRMFLC